MFEKNLCSRWRKRKENYDMQLKLDEQEERERATQDEVLEPKEKVAEAARKLRKKLNWNKNMVK